MANRTKDKNHRSLSTSEQLNVDSIVAEMNLDEFQSVLDQVINHSIPDSQKSPLVRKLNQQVAEDQENSLEACFRGNSFLDNSATTHDSNRSVKTDIINLPAIQSSASFNNVTPSSCTLPLDPSKPIRMNESNKVENSLQNLQQFCDDFMTRNPEYRPPTNPDAPSTSSSSCLQNGHSGHQPPITASSSASLPNRRNGNCEPLEIEMRDLGRKAQIVEYSSSLGVMKASGQSVDTFIDLSGSLGGGGEPSSNATKPNRAELAQVAACNTVYSNPTNGSHVSNSSFNNECSAARSNVFGSKSPTIKSKALNTVEKFFNPLGLNTAVIEGNGQYFLLLDKTVDNKPASYPMNSTFNKKAPSSIGNSTIQSTRAETLSKKRKKPEKAKLAEEIEGYVGDRDLEYLTNYVTGNIASKEAAKDAAQSKEPVSTSKRKEKRNKQPIVGVSSSSSSNDSSANCSSNSSANGSTNVIVCSQNGDAESDQSETKTNTICNGVGSTTDTTSSTKMDLKKKVMVTNRPVSTDPKQDLNRSQKESSDGELSLFEVKQLLYIASDSEIPNSDPDSGFQTVKYKQLRRKKKTNGFANVPSTASHGRSGYTIENVNHPAHRMSNDSCLNRSSVVTNDRRPASNPKASATVSTGVSSSSETAGLSVQKAIVNDPILNSIHSISEYPQLQRNSLNSESVDCSLCTDQSDKIKEEESLPSEHFDSALDDEDSFGKVNSTADDSLSRISYAAIARKQYETPAKDTASQHHSSDSATRINEILPSAVEEELPIDVGEFNHKMEVRNKITGQKLDRNEKPKTNNHSKSGEGKSKKAKTSSPVKSIESVSLSSDSSPRDSSSSGKDSDSREFTDSSTGNSSKETLTATEKEDMSSESLPVVIICGDDKVDSNDSHSSTGSGSRIGTGSAASAASFTFGFFDEGAKDEGKQNESVDTTTTANTTTNATEDGTLPGQCTDDLRISPSVEQVEADVPVRSRSDSKSQAEQPEWRRKMQSNGVNNNASNNNNYHGPRFNQSKEGNVATAVVKQILFGNPNKSDNYDENRRAGHSYSHSSSSRYEDDYKPRYRNTHQHHQSSNQSPDPTKSFNYHQVLNYIRKSWEEANRPNSSSNVVYFRCTN